MGNNAVAGTEAAICANGCATRAKPGLKPIVTPTGIVHDAPRTKSDIYADERRQRTIRAGCISARSSPASMTQARTTAVSKTPERSRATMKPSIHLFEPAGSLLFRARSSAATREWSTFAREPVE